MGKSINNVVKLNDFVSIKDYGAKNDSLTDNSSAFSSAISYLGVTNQYGGDLLLGGSATQFYLTSTAISLPNRVKLKGSGSNSTRIKYSGVSSPTNGVISSNVGGQWVYSTGIERLEVHGNGVANVGIRADAWNEGCFISDVIVRRTLSECIRFDNGSGADTYPNHQMTLTALHLLPQASKGIVLNNVRRSNISHITVNGNDDGYAYSPATTGIEVGDYSLHTDVNHYHAEAVDLPINISASTGAIFASFRNVTSTSGGRPAYAPAKRAILTTTLNGAIADGVTTSITLTDASKMPDATFVLLVDSEQMLVTVVNKTTGVCTVTRGYNSTTAVAHSNGASISLYGSVLFLNGSTSASGGVNDFLLENVRDDTAFDYICASTPHGFYVKSAVNVKRIDFRGAGSSIAYHSSVQIDGSTSPAITIKQSGTSGTSTVRLVNSADNGIDVWLDSSSSELKIATVSGGTAAAPSVKVSRSTGLTTLSNVALSSAVSTTSATAGGATALPATPQGYITVNINGTDRKIPYYAL